jgi:ferredoxin
VRKQQPVVLDRLCIGCAACIEACESSAFAIEGVEDDLPDVKGFPAVIPPSLLLQFGPAVGPRSVMDELDRLGFEELYLTQAWEEALRQAVVQYAQREAGLTPVISPACPAVVNLVTTRFPSLIAQLAPFLSPLEAARDELAGQPPVFVVLCPAQGTALRNRSAGMLRTVSVSAVKRALMPAVHERRQEASRSPKGAAKRMTNPRLLEASGIRHVVRILDEAEKGLLADVQVLELFACDDGCFGSPLLSEDPFVAQMRWGMARDRAKASAHAVRRTEPFPARIGLRLDESMALAVEKLARIDELTKRLPGNNCSACGAPSCESLAEDIVLGRAAEAECVRLNREMGGPT